MNAATSFLVRLYFVVVSAVTLVIVSIALGSLLNTGLKTYIFPAANVPAYLESCLDQYDMYPDPIKDIDAENEISEEERIEACESRNARAVTSHRQSEASQAVQSLATLLVALPLFLLHFRIVYRDWKKIKS